jgi:hypothetical protein
MLCQHCGKACANRTEGRRMNFAGQDLFLCNVCALHAEAANGGGDEETIPRGPRAAPDGGMGCSPRGRR